MSALHKLVESLFCHWDFLYRYGGYLYISSLSWYNQDTIEKTDKSVLISQAIDSALLFISIGFSVVNRLCFPCWVIVPTLYLDWRYRDMGIVFFFFSSFSSNLNCIWLMVKCKLYLNHWRNNSENFTFIRWPLKCCANQTMIGNPVEFGLDSIIAVVQTSSEFKSEYI